MPLGGITIGPDSLQVTVSRLPPLVLAVGEFDVHRFVLTALFDPGPLGERALVALSRRPRSLSGGL